jgi:CRP-like cAMP-binding protein
VSEPDLNELAKVSRIFEALDAGGRHKLLSLSTHRHAKSGEVICREGDPGGEFFVISSGEVRVSADGLEGEKEIATLGQGQFFGEMAALNGDRRVATCTAIGDVELVAFPAAAVEKVLAENPKAREALHNVGVLRSDAMLNKMME